MSKRWAVFAVVGILVAAFTLPALAQESAVSGNLSGVVYDTSGAVVPGATVALTGATGTRTTTSDEKGAFLFQVLPLGTYSLKVEKSGFKTVVLSDLQVFTNRTTSIRTTLQPGAVTESIEVSGGASTVDTTSTALSTNLNDTFFSRIPVPRGVAGLFYLAPGVTSGGASGAANPSISGGSGLENQYTADGVDITDTAFGGLGVFSRVYGSVATGINLSFIKEVQVKTGGFEPQYGKATGGIVQIVTKSGGNEYHGQIAGYWQPNQTQSTPQNADNFNLVNPFGKLIHSADADVDFEVGGYVPTMRDKLFFFASFNPSERQQTILAPPQYGLFQLGELTNRTLSYNYAAKGTYKINENHQIEASIFGDPSHTNRDPWRRVNQGTPGIADTTGFSKLDFGTRNVVARYNGVFSPTWLANVSVTWGHNHFDESGFADFQRILDQTQTDGLSGQIGQFTPIGLGFLENTEDTTYGLNLDTSKIFHFGGEHNFTIGYRLERAFYSGTRSRSGPKVPVPGTNASGNSDRMGGSAEATGSLANYEWRLLPADDSCTLCPYMAIPGVTGSGPNGMSRVLLRMLRSEFGLNAAGEKGFSTNSTYHVGYVNDSWTFNRYVTLNVGLRWEQEYLSGENTKYTFTDNWSPRIGVSVDPFGDRKNKIYANFGRYTYALPLDLAERSLTNELDLFGFRLAPDFTVDGSGNRIATLNANGTVTPIVDPAHVLNGATGGVTNSTFASFESGEPIFPGTKMTYEDEWMVGAEHEFPHGIKLSAKYIRRDLKRIVEDTGGISPEAALAGVNQQFGITNVSASTDIFVNPDPFAHNVPVNTPVCNADDPFCGSVDASGTFTPTTVPSGTPSLEQIAPACVVPGSSNSTVTPTDAPFYAPEILSTLGTVLGAVCFNPAGTNGADLGSIVLGGDGIPDGFPNPVRQYWAVEFEVDKQFSHNWQLRANWRIARLFGNFEGALRNDNGQTDPGISSLYDFTAGSFNLLGDQFTPGPLNTDRMHIINTQFSYVFDHTALKGLTLGTNVRVQTGTPISEFFAHPVYENAGEVPVGGRGKLGRTPVTGTIDFHADYPFQITERLKLHFVADFFNLANTKRILAVNQNKDLGFGTVNADFQKPTQVVIGNTAALGDGFVQPFKARFGFKLAF